jgi:hypothetical protein
MHVFALSVICDGLHYSFILRYICIFSLDISDVTYGFVGLSLVWCVAVLNVFVGAEVC